ncbi:hypothetical protein GIB67_025541 [Kingdonia uniflora]|uniref:RNase H type-1 domain-containing protein n=1 Tax=Kingdonia uniflora TaxID=39325 RepID=A0A7J7M0F6_9MAGN|nr:hypothetical protein GIB67_025541 [Kingdonia uniflora]
MVAILHDQVKDHKTWSLIMFPIGTGTAKGKAVDLQGDLRHWNCMVGSLIMPLINMYKLNTDGSARGSSGLCGCGGVVRNHNGELVFAYSVGLGTGTNNMAELYRQLIDLRHCITHNWFPLVVEVDSLMIANWYNGIGIIEGSSSCNKANKNGRGYAKPWSEWDNGKFKILEWNEDCQPLGPNEPKLMSHLGGDYYQMAWFHYLLTSKMVRRNGLHLLAKDDVITEDKAADIRPRESRQYPTTWDQNFEVASIFHRLLCGLLKGNSDCNFVKDSFALEVVCVTMVRIRSQRAHQAADGHFHIKVVELHERYFCRLPYEAILPQWSLNMTGLDDEGKRAEYDHFFWCDVFRRSLLSATVQELTVRQLVCDKIVEEDVRAARGKIILCGEANYRGCFRCDWRA